MKKKNKGLLILVLLLVVTIGIGYAATNTDKVNITGTASAATDFDIQFSNVSSDITKNTGQTATTKNDDIKVEAAYDDVDNATIKVTGLKYVGDYGEATFTILNKSTDLKANITAAVSSTITDTTHYEVTTTMGTGSDSVAAKTGSTTVTVRVTLKKAFADQEKAKEEQTFTVTATGTAVEE